MQNSLRLCLQWLVILLLPIARPAFAQNLALNKTATATSGSAGLAVDGVGSTRWESASTDQQAITIDLGSVQAIDRIRLTWENAYGKDFTLQVSSDGTTWTVVKTIVDNATTANEYPNLNTSGRYVKMDGTKRATTYGFSLYEFEVFNYSTNSDNLAFGKPATASTTQGGFPVGNALDNSNSSRWGSTPNLNAASLAIDLRGEATISRVYLVWETAYGKNFTVEVSEDAVTWTTVKTMTNNTLHFNEFLFSTPVTGRYVRMNGTARGNTGPDYGFSLYEFQVTGSLQPLPVTLTSFSAAPQGTGVAVSWTTASEKNNAGFEVQRSADGVDFTALAFVGGMGTTQSTHAYTYVDANPLATTGYYRLKQLDTDGTFAYSPVAAVPATATIAASSIYPNPTTDRATVTWETPLAGAGRWYLTNTMGQVMHAEALSGETTANLSIDLQAYPTGSYVLTVEAGGKVVRRGRVQKVN